MKSNIKRYYFYIFLAGFTIWIAENIFFGWNEKPESSVEKFFDIVSWVLMFWGIAGDLLSNLTIVKKYTMNDTTTINAEKVEFSPNLKNTTLKVNGEELKKK